MFCMEVEKDQLFPWLDIKILWQKAVIELMGKLILYERRDHFKKKLRTGVF